MGKEAIAPTGVSAVDTERLAQQSRRRALLAIVLVAVLVAAATAIILAVFMGNGTSAAADSVTLDEYNEKPFGDILIMRHALAPGSGDPQGFALENCSSQRNLGSDGIAQATDIGEKLGKSSLRISETIYTSQWCRCRDTARLIAAQLNRLRHNNSAAAGGYFSVEEEWGLNSFYQPERGGFTKAACIERLDGSILGRLKAIPIDDRDGSLILMVTHKVTVTDVTGVDVDSGGIVAYDSKTGEAKLLKL